MLSIIALRMKCTTESKSFGGILSGLEFTFLSRPSPTSAKWVPLTQENRMLDIEV